MSSRQSPGCDPAPCASPSPALASPLTVTLTLCTPPQEEEQQEEQDEDEEEEEVSLSEVSPPQLTTSSHCTLTRLAPLLLRSCAALRVDGCARRRNGLFSRQRSTATSPTSSASWRRG